MAGSLILPVPHRRAGHRKSPPTVTAETIVLDTNLTAAGLQHKETYITVTNSMLAVICNCSLCFFGQMVTV